MEDTITDLIRHGRDREAATLGHDHLAARPEGTRLDPLAQLDAVIPLLVDLVAGLGARHLDAPTPCDRFTIRDVLAHMVGGATAFAAAFRGEAASEAGPPADLLAAFPSAMAGLHAAVRSPGALDRTIAAPFGEVAGETFARFVALDGLVHGWDLSTAAGLGYDPPILVVHAVAEFAATAVPGLRDGETFADAATAPDDASDLERLVAFTGRVVPR